MLVAKVSPISGVLNTMDLPVTPKQVEAWRTGSPIQDVMPHLSVVQRDFLEAGITPEDWAWLFFDDE